MRETEHVTKDRGGIQKGRNAIFEFRDRYARAACRMRQPILAALARLLCTALLAAREGAFARRDRGPAIFSRASSGLSGRVRSLPLCRILPMRALSTAMNASSSAGVTPYSRQA